MGVQVSSPGLEEAELVAAAAQGDRAAAGALVERHWDELFRVADLILRDPHAAEDTAQEALLAGLTALDGFDRSRALRPWLVGIVTNRAIDRARSRSRAEPVPPGDLERLEADAAPEPEQQRGDLRTALEHLDPDARALLVLRYVLDYRSGEIAELLGVPDGTVRSRLKRTLDLLRVDLTKEAP